MVGGLLGFCHNGAKIRQNRDFSRGRPVPLAKVWMGNGTPSFRLVEPQANQFTLEFLMPACFINALDNEEDLVQRFGVSWEAARNRLLYLHKKE